jgi:hypothetical protein
MTWRRVLFAGLFFGLSVSSGGQEAHGHAAGDATKLGKVHFPVSCAPLAAARFERAVAMLHSFWYEAVEKEFADIVQADPRCAMGYWGQAMSQNRPLWPDPPRIGPGRQALEKARAARAKTRRERDYIAALGTFFDAPDETDRLTRARRYEAEMEKIFDRYPQDREAGAFYALALLDAASLSDKTYARQLKAAAILERLFRDQPDHPGAAHYIIHSFDVPALAPRGLTAARAYAKIAPAAPHALHMPSHIFTRLGLWTESIDSNRASADAARAYERASGMSGAWDERLHALDYLEYAFLQIARDKDARQVLEEVSGIQNAQPQNLKAAYAFVAVPARFALERGHWDEAAQGTRHPADFPWERFPYAEAVWRFARGVGAARSGRLEAAADELASLEKLHASRVEAKDAYWADQVEVLRLEVDAHVAEVRGHRDDAMRLARVAADLEDSSEKHAMVPGAILPAREQLAELLLAAGRPQEALNEFEAVLRDAPGRFRSLAGAAKAAELSGDRKKAKSFSAVLLSQCQGSESERPELAAARAATASR